MHEEARNNWPFVPTWTAFLVGENGYEDLFQTRSVLPEIPQLDRRSCGEMGNPPMRGCCNSAALQNRQSLVG